MLKINANRLWGDLMLVAQIGGTPEGGCNRQALTSLDKQVRDLFVKWCKDAGCRISIDAIGNIFARKEGMVSGAKSILIGSHLDTQPTGGRFDGVYGVLAGLEVIRTLNDAEIEISNAIEIVCWTNEEGARFSPAMLGSGVWSGAFDLEYAYERTDKSNITVKDALTEIGYLGGKPTSPDSIKAAIELHIEQGPILEHSQKSIGIVSGVQGIRWYDIILTGVSCHAGPSPMSTRKDPVLALSPIIQSLYAFVEKYGPWSRITFGDIQVKPGARNTVPETIILSLDLRHPDQTVLDEMDQDMRNHIQTICDPLGLSGEVKDEWHSPAVSFDDLCINAIKASVDQLAYSSADIFSGAGHDSVYVSQVVPSGMIFIPCDGGISHNALENISINNAEEGCNVLLHSVINLACESGE